MAAGWPCSQPPLMTLIILAAASGRTSVAHHEDLALNGLNRKWDVALALRRCLHCLSQRESIPEIVLSHNGTCMQGGEGAPARSPACLESSCHGWCRAAFRVIIQPLDFLFDLVEIVLNSPDMHQWFSVIKEERCVISSLYFVKISITILRRRTRCVSIRRRITQNPSSAIKN